MHVKFKFPVYGQAGRGENNLRQYLVGLLNQAQDRFTFGIFTTNATNFHSDGCIYVVNRGHVAHTRYSSLVINWWGYGNSTPSVWADGVTNFDSAYIAAREFIRVNCGI